MSASSWIVQKNAAFIMSERSFEKFLERFGGSASEVKHMQDSVVLIFPNDYTHEQRVRELEAIAKVQS